METTCLCVSKCNYQIETADYELVGEGCGDPNNACKKHCELVQGMTSNRELI